MRPGRKSYGIRTVCLRNAIKSAVYGDEGVCNGGTGFTIRNCARKGTGRGSRALRELKGANPRLPTYCARSLAGGGVVLRRVPESAVIRRVDGQHVFAGDRQLVPLSCVPPIRR